MGDFKNHTFKKRKIGRHGDENGDKNLH